MLNLVQHPGRRCALAGGRASHDRGVPPWTLKRVQGDGEGAASCVLVPTAPYAARESGGRRSRQPGQVRKEAAVTSSRVGSFRLPPASAEATAGKPAGNREEPARRSLGEGGPHSKSSEISFLRGSSS